MDIVLDRFVSPWFLIVGLSYATQPKLWVNFFQNLRRSGVAAAIIPIYTLPLGLILIVGHNRWVWGWPLLLTVVSWSMTTKCVIYLLYPPAAERAMVIACDFERGFRVVGIVVAILGGIMTWSAYLR